MKKTFLLLICFFSIGVLSAQEKLSKEEKERRQKNIQAGNPFIKYGSKAPVATLSKGKYLEVHDLDSIVTIGTMRWQVDKKQIVGQIEIDSLDTDAQPIGDVPGRWMSPDPLSEEFTQWSPYTMCYDNPVKFIDPDGKAAIASDGDFEPDKNGNLIVEKGDTPEKLKQEYGVVVTNKNFEFKPGNVILLDNNMTKAIEQSDGVTVTEARAGSDKPKDNVNDMYVCDQATTMAVSGEPITAKNAQENHSGLNGTFDPRGMGMKSVSSFSGAKSGQAAADIGGNHSVTYYGTSNNGTVYVFSKDGRFKPEVKPLTTVLNQMKAEGMGTTPIQYFKK